MSKKSKNVIDAKHLFKKEESSWDIHETIDFCDGDEMAFICHVFGYDPKKEKKIVEAVANASGGRVALERQLNGESQELAGLYVAENTAEVRYIWSLSGILNEAILGANRRPLFFVSAAINKGLAHCVVDFPDTNDFVVTPRMLESLGGMEFASLLTEFDHSHCSTGDVVSCERLIELMHQAIFCFGRGKPSSVASVRPVGSKDFTVHMQWFMTNLSAVDSSEDRIFHNMWYSKYLLEGAGSLEEMIDMMESATGELRAMNETGKVFLCEDGVQDGFAHLHTHDPEIAAQFGFEEGEDEE